MRSSTLATPVQFGHAGLTPRRGFLALLGAAAVAGMQPATAAFADATPPASAPKELDGTTSGVVMGSTGGSYAYYTVSHPGAGKQTVSLSYLPYDAPRAHTVGISVYQAGKKLGSATGQSSGLGDPASSNVALLSITPDADGGPLLIQVFAYSVETVIYTLTVSSLAKPVPGPTYGTADHPLPLGSGASGTLPPNTAGSFAYYQLSNPTGATQTLLLGYGPFADGQAHRIGLTAYQDGKRLASTTAQAVSLGDHEDNDFARLIITPGADAGPVLIQVFNYSPDAISFAIGVS